MGQPTPPRKSTSAASYKSAAYQYLPIECPKCKFQGKVKITRLDQTFHCKQCGKVFHITLDGTVTGERPAEELTYDPAALVVAEKPSFLERWFGKLPPAVRFSVLGVLALALAYGASLLMEPAEPLPGELEGRAALAAKSFASGDWKTLKRLAKSGTARSLGKWFDRNRPSDWPTGTESRAAAKVENVNQQLVKYEKAKPILDAQATTEVSVQGRPPLEVLLIFSQDKSGDWSLDGDRMLEISKPKKKSNANARQAMPSGN